MTYDTLANEKSIQKASQEMTERGIEVIVVESGAEALEKIKSLIPSGASVMNGSSITLEQIGFMEYLNSGKSGWNNLHANITAENDKEKRAQLRKESVLSDYYLGSVHAIAETGELVIASNSGSQLPHIVYTSPNVIFVAGAQKIVPTLAEAMKRLETYVLPLEDQHMKDVGYGGSVISKVLIFNRENKKISQRAIRMILIKEKLGF